VDARAPTHISSSVHGGQTVLEGNHFFLEGAMAILFYANHRYDTFPHVQDIVDKYTQRTWAEHSEVGWLELHLQNPRSHISHLVEKERQQ